MSNLSGSCQSATFTLNGRQVYTTSATEFQRGPCRDLRNNVTVEVQGTLMSDNRVRADRIRFEKDDDDDGGGPNQ